MCGITGFTWNDKQLLKRMCRSISHRGPDQNGTYVDKNISLGHQRLSIIDLSEKGRQPMCNEDGTVWITFNGEIYNYLDLKPDLEARGHRFSSASDTEVIIHLYEEYGEQCVEKLWGDFAFAIYDNRVKKIFLARDRIGVKPLYYHFNQKTKQFMFASEIKALLANNDVPREINTASLRQYMTYRYIFGSHTILKNITRLLPGECLTFDLQHKKFTTLTYWNINADNANIVKKSEQYYLKRFLQLYEDSVQRRLMSDVPLGVYLSGGIDSSSIVAMMHRIKQKNHDLAETRTFSIGFGYGPATDEIAFSRAVSEHFNTNHQEFTIRSDAIQTLPTIVWHCDEPLADPALIPAYFLSQEAKKHVTVVLTGDGGDETFAGYEQTKFMNLAHTIQKIPFARHLAPVGLKVAPSFLLKKIFKYSDALGNRGIARAAALLASTNKAHAYSTITSIFDDKELANLGTDAIKTAPSAVGELHKKFFAHKKNNLINRIAYLEMKTLLPENMLMKSDKMTMAHAIEARVPLLDHRITELAFQMPPHLKLNSWKEKYILKQSMRGKLPPHIVQRKKQRFYVPIDRWIHDDLRSVVDTLLSRDIISKQGYFSHDHITKIQSRYNRAPLFYARQLWTLLTFQIWHALYIDGKKPSKLL